jgi:NAD(P)-dependent dehydrogenase (short-subunit alcohol dehydrogenase family)
MNVHVMGTIKPAKAVWEIMKAQNYGRIVVTTSSTGLYGNFGQTNYGAAKLALVGLHEHAEARGREERHPGQRDLAGGGDAHDRKPDAPRHAGALKPEYVTPGVVYLASRDAPNGRC